MSSTSAFKDGWCDAADTGPMVPTYQGRGLWRSAILPGEGSTASARGNPPRPEVDFVRQARKQCKDLKAGGR